MADQKSVKTAAGGVASLENFDASGYEQLALQGISADNAAPARAMPRLKTLFNLSGDTAGVSFTGDRTLPYDEALEMELPHRKEIRTTLDDLLKGHADLDDIIAYGRIRRVNTQREQDLQKKRRLSDDIILQDILDQIAESHRQMLLALEEADYHFGLAEEYLDRAEENMIQARASMRRKLALEEEMLRDGRDVHERIRTLLGEERYNRVKDDPDALLDALEAGLEQGSRDSLLEKWLREVRDAQAQLEENQKNCELASDHAERGNRALERARERAREIYQKSGEHHAPLPENMPSMESHENRSRALEDRGASLERQRDAAIAELKHAVLEPAENADPAIDSDLGDLLEAEEDPAAPAQGQRQMDGNLEDPGLIESEAAAAPENQAADTASEMTMPASITVYASEAEFLQKFTQRLTGADVAPATPVSVASTVFADDPHTASNLTGVFARAHDNIQTALATRPEEENKPLPANNMGLG